MSAEHAAPFSSTVPGAALLVIAAKDSLTFDKGPAIPAVPGQSGWNIPKVIMAGKLGEVLVFRRNRSCEINA